jgi:hypothetical protein
MRQRRRFPSCFFDITACHLAGTELFGAPAAAKVAQSFRKQKSLIDLARRQVLADRDILRCRADSVATRGNRTLPFSHPR